MTCWLSYRRHPGRHITICEYHQCGISYYLELILDRTSKTGLLNVYIHNNYSCSFKCHCMALVSSFIDVFHWNIINRFCVLLSFLFHSHDIKSSKHTLKGNKKKFNWLETNRKQMKTILSISFSLNTSD